MTAYSVRVYVCVCVVFGYTIFILYICIVLYLLYHLNNILFIYLFTCLVIYPKMWYSSARQE